MDFRILLSIAILASVTRLSSADCQIKNRDATGCNYTVACTTDPSSVPLPNATCNYTYPYVTFDITGSKRNVLNNQYFSLTNFDHLVQVITAIGNSWRNIDPFTFRYYKKCTKMYMVDNKIEYIQNNAFRNLKSLQYLNISHNKIKLLKPKSFFVTYDGGSRLQILDLSYNSLVEISDEFSVMPNLRELYLQNNNITSIADDAIINLTDLNYLNLRSNKLKSLNSTLRTFKYLTTLDVSDNHLLKILTFEIGNLSALVSFNASHNDITLIEDQCFIQAPHMQLVDFSCNKIQSRISNTLFSMNPRLEYVDFSNNVITNIQDHAFHSLLNLSYINLENNLITGEIDEFTFSTLRNLTKLDLSRQNIKIIERHAFSDITSPLNLKLSDNAIEYIKPDSFYNIVITVLDLSFNRIHDLRFMEGCLQNLNELYLNNNNIREIPSNTFKNKSEIKKMDLSMNWILKVEKNSIPFINLRYFNITGNNLQGVIRKNMFSPAKYLRILDLSHFNITEIDDSAFVDLEVLFQLNLSHNHIKEIHPNNFKGVNNIYSLDISNNKLIDLAFNTRVLNIVRSLNLNNNKLTNVSKLFLNNSYVMYLDMSSNNISDLFNVDAALLPRIYGLYLSNNKIRYFNNPSINTLLSLTYLDLSSNRICDINLSYFKYLQTVNLSDNKLSYINSSSLSNNERLVSLDLSRNNITDLPLDTFKFLKNLKFLNLSSNFLTTLLEPAILRGLNNIETLDLSRNNITDINVDVFYQCDELKTLLIDYNNIKTFEVERLITPVNMTSFKNPLNLTTLSLKSNPILCKKILHNINSSNAKLVYDAKKVELTLFHRNSSVVIIKCENDTNVDKKILISSNRTDSTDMPSTIPSTTVFTPANENASVKPDSLDSKGISQTTSSSLTLTTIVLICCGITAFLVGTIAFIYMKVYKKRVIVVNGNMTKQTNNAIVMEQYTHSDASE